MEVEMEVVDDNSYSSGDETLVEYSFTAVEIDIDYEFDAARFFDFTRIESVDEAREAEMWFESVGSYPPSPRLLCRGKSENGNDPTTSKSVASDIVRALEDSTIFSSNTACAGQVDSESFRKPVEAGLETAASTRGTQGLTDTCLTDNDLENEGVVLNLKTYYRHEFQKQQTSGSIPKDSTQKANCKSKTRPSWKPSFSRTSTLMKPTTSQLAKQNQDRLIDHSRLQKAGNNSSGVETQAAKRQKLEEGHLCKVTDMKQETKFFHKAPKKEATTVGNLRHGRSRITVPKTPDLATAQRAHRIRKKGDDANEHVASRGLGFRARPLNRKIFEAPSLLHQKNTPQLPEFQEYHLKTTERAVQATAVIPSTSTCSKNLKAPKKHSLVFNTESRSRGFKGGVHKPLKPTELSKLKQEDCKTVHGFKALPLNKKIFSSKGDLGVYRSSKREATIAMAFNFETDKRAQHAPPVDLFNKLSLASESGSRSSRPPSIFTKGLKENRVCSVKQQSEVSTPKPGSKHVHFANTTAESTLLSTISRNLGTR